MTNNTIKKITNTALAGIGAAMGIATCVLGFLDTSISTENLIAMLGIGVAALGILALDHLNKK